MLSTFAKGRLVGETYGAGAPEVLALHGWARTHLDFLEVLRPADAPELAALALDLPGFGAAPPPPEAWGSAQYAAGIEEVLESMATPVVVLGHSFGGRVAVELAARRPDAVRAVVLSGVPLLRTAGGRPAPAFGYRLLRRLARSGLVSEERLEQARRRYGSADYAAASGTMREVLVRIVAEDYTEALSAIVVPVELVWGELDTAAPLEMARRAESLLADARLTVLPGIDHFTPLRAPAALREAVLAHLR